jgi:hypothetical protein
VKINGSQKKGKVYLRMPLQAKSEGRPNKPFSEMLIIFEIAK